MKLLRTMHKNMRLLLRSKFSAVAILVGPLLIMLLIGFAFTTSSSYDLAIGIEQVNDTELATRFIENMREQGFLVHEFENISDCVDRIEKGTLQTCLKFPDDFSLDNNKTNELVFYVDESRTNFVYQIIDSISSNIGTETSEISEDLTNKILDVLFDTEQGIDSGIADVIKLKADAEKAISDADKGKGIVEGINLETDDVDTDPIADGYNTMYELNDDLRAESAALLSKGRLLLNELDDESYAGLADTSGFDTVLDTLYTYLQLNDDERDVSLEEFEIALEELNAILTDYEDQISLAATARDETVKEISSFRESIENVRQKMTKLKTHLEDLNKNIDTLRITSGQTIANPITSRIEAVSSSGDQLLYLLPYLIMLVVMFIGLLLPATLVVMEKRSKSSFRMFCTPTSDRIIMLAHFLTSLLILIVQITILIGLTYYFLGDAINTNILVTLSLLLLGIILFILMGMALGYIFSRQEAVTMASISLGSIFIFLSNLVLPLETLGSNLQSVSMFNPYVLTSEAMRRALLFGTTFKELTPEFVTLAACSAIILVLIVIVKDIVKSRYRFHLAFSRGHKHLQHPSDMYLHVGSHQIKNLQEFHDWLVSVDDRTFKEHLQWKETRKWLSHKKSLRVKLAGKSRRQMIKVLEKHLRR